MNALNIGVRRRDRHMQHWRSSERRRPKAITAGSDATTLRSALTVRISHCRLSTATFCIRASRFRNSSEHEWQSEGVQWSVLIVLNIGVPPRDRHAQH